MSDFTGPKPPNPYGQTGALRTCWDEGYEEGYAMGGIYQRTLEPCPEVAPIQIPAELLESCYDEGTFPFVDRLLAHFETEEIRLIALICLLAIPALTIITVVLAIAEAS
jgi:hypothetical protein